MKRLVSAILFASSLICSASHALEQTTIEFADRTIQVELALSLEEQRQGLMGRQSLLPDTGMLFVYPQPQQLSFWMKKTLISLDILFFSADGVLQEIVHNAQPCRLSPCRTYHNSKPSQYVLEVPAGTADQWGIAPGMSFDFLQ